MPKEVTHWLIAQQTAAALKGSALGDLAADFPNCLRLGAVIHDAAFYVRDRRWKQAMLQFGDAAHGRGSDCFALVADVARAAAQARHPGPVRAMLIGMLTHIAADSCFHPLVYHQTGNYHDPDPARRTLAVQRHRCFEAMLDVYLAGTLKTITAFSLKRTLRCCELRPSTLVREAFTTAAADSSSPQFSAALLHCLRVFARMQALYAMPVITPVLDALHPALPAGAREIAALFYVPRCVAQAPGLHGARTWPHVETGAMQTATILELYRSAIELSLELCRELEGALLGAEPFTPPRTRLSPDCAVQAARHSCSGA